MRPVLGFLPVAALVAALLGALHLALRPDPSRANFEFFPDMARSVAAESFAAEALLPGGAVLQAPQPGVVVRGAPSFPYGPGPDEARRAGAELRSPIAADDAAALARGQQVYRNVCVVCHGAGGDGRSPVTARGMLAPPSLLGARAVELSDGELFHIVTRGQGNMASHAAQVEASDRWKVIAWVRAMQKGTSR